MLRSTIIRSRRLSEKVKLSFLGHSASVLSPAAQASESYRTLRWPDCPFSRLSPRTSPRSSQVCGDAQSVLRAMASAIQSRKACSCATSAGPRMKPVAPPQPGTVNAYTHHIMIRIPEPDSKATGDSSIWWPPIMEKHPALVQAFGAVAECKANVSGTVKVTAYEHMEVLDRSGDQSKVDMLLFPAGAYYSRIPYDKINEIVTYHIQDFPEGTARPAIPSLGKKSSRGDFRGVGLFICTHMSRDSRCGQLGLQLAERLQELVDERGYDAVRIYQASHVGGHKFAGNVLVYGGITPCDGDWFGGITCDNAEQFLDRIVKMEIGVEGGAGDDYLRQFWRGRMNMTKEEQIALFENPDAPLEDEFEMPDSDSSSSSSSSSSASDVD